MWKTSCTEGRRKPDSKGRLQRGAQAAPPFRGQRLISMDRPEHLRHRRSQHLRGVALQLKAHEPGHVAVAAKEEHLNKLPAEPLQIVAHEFLRRRCQRKAALQLGILKQFLPHGRLTGGGKILRCQIKMEQMALDAAVIQYQGGLLRQPALKQPLLLHRQTVRVKLPGLTEQSQLLAVAVLFGRFLQQGSRLLRNTLRIPGKPRTAEWAKKRLRFRQFPPAAGAAQI